MPSRTTFSSLVRRGIFVASLVAFLPHAAANTHFANEPGSCQIIGDVDVYGMLSLHPRILKFLADVDDCVGIGIRLGYYLQYIAVTLCVISNRIDDLKGARNGFNAFSIALLVNLYRNASTDLAIEWYLVFLLAVILPLNAVLSVTSPEDHRNSLLSITIQWLLQVAFFFSVPYLFFAAMDNGRKAECEIKVFAFKELDLYRHRWQVTGRVCSIVGIFLGIIQCLVLASVLKGARRVTQSHEDGRQVGMADRADSTTFIEAREDMESKSRQKSRLLRALSLVLILSGAVAIAFIEKTIQINNLDMSAGPITAGGQFIPLVIGAYVLFLTIMAVLKKAFLRLVRWTSDQKSFSGVMQAIYRELHTTIHFVLNEIDVSSTSERSHSPERVPDGHRAEGREDGNSDIELGHQPVEANFSRGQRDELCALPPSGGNERRHGAHFGSRFAASRDKSPAVEKN
jgi:hypothetical protein